MTAALATRPAAETTDSTDRNDREATRVRVERYYPIGAPFPRRGSSAPSAIQTEIASRTGSVVRTPAPVRPQRIHHSRRFLPQF